MAPELRNTGISVVGDVPWGTHFCTFYETKQDLLDILIPFFKTGLESNEFCLWIISNSELLTMQQARNALQEVLPDLDRHITDKNIEVAGHDWFFNGGSFDFRRVANQFKKKVDEALTRGFVGMRVNGSPAWLQTSDQNALLKFEEHVNQLFSHQRIIASCTYPLPESRADFLLDVTRNHQFAIARRRGNWDIVETPQLIQAKAEIGRLNAELEQRVVERTKELEETTEQLRAEIEDRKEADEAVRQSQAKLRQAQQLAHIGYWERDLIADRITWSNETGRILGLESFRGVANQAQLREFIHPDDWQHHQQVFNEALQGSRLFDVEVRWVRPDGNIRFVHIRDEIVRDESGKPIRMFGAVQDITERRRAEDETRRQKEILQQIFDHIPVMIGFVGRDGRIKLVNREWERTLGWSLENILKPDFDTFAELYPDPKVRAETLDFIAKKDGVWADFKTRVRDGRVIDTTWANVHLSDGTAIGIGQDITERKQAEDALRRSEEHLRLVIDTIPTMAWTSQPDGVVDFINQRWLDYAGLTLEQYLKDPMGTVHPADVPRVVENWGAARMSGKPYEDEMRLRGGDGEYRWFLVRSEPLRDKQGNIVKWYGSSIDIEDRKQAEEKLKHSEVQLAQAQRLAHIGSWDWDLRTNEVTWSDELYHIFGLQPGTISVAGEVDRFIHPDDLDLGWDTVRRAIASKEPYDYYHRILRPDGAERIARSRGSIMSDERGEPIKVFGATQDVTELKQAEAKLKETSEQLRALSASVQTAREQESKRIAREIHDELGGALTSWRWDLEEVRDTISEPLDSSQVAAVRTKIEAMIKLTETTLDTVRKLSSELRPAALELGLVEAIEWQALQFENRTGIPVQLECVMEKVDLDNGQATAAFRILQEALTNIQRHAQATRVTITCWEESGRFFLTIEDNGRGITESEKSARQSLGLLGMGERAHLAGGEIDIESVEGEGTKITVRVPLTDDQSSRPAGKPEDKARHAG